MSSNPSGRIGPDDSPRVERFDPRRHDVSGFQCGEHSLDQYLRERALSDRRRRAAVLYVLVPANGSHEDQSQRTVIGFYTVNTLSISKSRLPKRVQRKVGQYPEVSAALIRRLAVDAAYQVRRFGESLLAESVERIAALADELAIALVVVHALHERAANFYIRFGFEPFADNPLHLFYPLGSFVEEFEETRDHEE